VKLRLFAGVSVFVMTAGLSACSSSSDTSDDSSGGSTTIDVWLMRDSVLQLASFEKTADHVFEAGQVGKVDPIEGVSESVIVGKTMRVGTGSVEVVRYLNVDQKHDLKKRATPFEDAWATAARRGR